MLKHIVQWVSYGLPSVCFIDLVITLRLNMTDLLSLFTEVSMSITES